jgi:SAM-dependent MidA family methyltransferase
MHAREPLPEPDELQQLQSQALARHLVRLADERGGFLPFDVYMHEALYASGLGYYSAGATKFGAAGDFVTAPEISPLFGAALAAQLAQITTATAPLILELGAGSASLALAVLRAYENAGVPLSGYRILEVSADLATRQKELLSRQAPALVGKVTWLQSLPDVISGAVVLNEVLDAIPCSIAEFEGDGGVSEIGVRASAEGGLALDKRAADARFIAALREVLPEDITLPPGYRAEFNPQARALITTLASRIDTGCALVIDYGFPGHEFYHPARREGTLMAHYRHRAHGDILAWPGLQDITAHVDFSAIAHAADDADATLYGYASQASFLMNCGILDLIGPSVSHKAHAELLGGVQRLLSEAEMGELFKVLAFGRGLDEPLLGFASGNRLSAL